jgi:hypothetical protein
VSSTRSRTRLGAPSSSSGKEYLNCVWGANVWLVCGVRGGKELDAADHRADDPDWLLVDVEEVGRGTEVDDDVDADGGSNDLSLVDF